MIPDSKPFWQSKTFWTNALLFSAAKVPALQPVLNADTLPAIFTALCEQERSDAGMNIVALVRVALEALTAWLRCRPLEMLRLAEMNLEHYADDLREAADSTAVARVDELRTRLDNAKRYHAALLTAVSGLASRPDGDHPQG
jgi:hypothetical protein